MIFKVVFLLPHSCCASAGASAYNCVYAYASPYTSVAAAGYASSCTYVYTSSCTLAYASGSASAYA